MAKEQYIPKNWRQEVERHCFIMEAAMELSTRFAPGPEYEKAWDGYEAVCNDFLSYLEPYFGSARDFGLYLRADARQQLSRGGLSADLADNDYPWDIQATDKVFAAQQAKSLYEISYSEILDGIAHRKAFHHAAPEFSM